jgi:hypothetical protein
MNDPTVLESLDLWSEDLSAEELPDVASASTVACIFTLACFGGCFSTVSSVGSAG